MIPINMEKQQKRLHPGIRAVFIFMAGLVLITGCSAKKNVTGDLLPDDLPKVWASEVSIEALPITTSLLKMINDDSLRQLVFEALENNPNLSATALRLKAAEHLLYGPKSRLMPRLNAGFSAERNNQTVSLSGKNKTENRHQMSIGLAWEIDIWGRLADEYNSAKKTVLSQSENYIFARDALAARIIQTWIDQVAIRRSVNIESERIEVIKHIETILMERFKDGIGSLDELSTAKSRTEIAKADLSARKTALIHSIRKLEVLLGRYPKGELLIGTELPSVASTRIDIPANVLLNRPDIRAAMALVESARSISHAAKKARLPSLQVSGQVFKESARLGQIGSTTAYWGILGSLFQPLFEGGRLKKEATARKIESEAELAAFRQVVLIAVNEVENVMDMSKDFEIQIRAIESALKESEKSSQYFEERYVQGLDSIQNLLIAKEQEISVKNRLNELQAEKLKNRVDLAMALGVGIDDDSKRSEGGDR